jgi:anti-sigma-K factor RskA
MTHEELEADLALLALGSLDPEDRRVVEEHLAGGCATCTRELAEWQRVVDLIPLAAPEAEAPPLKDRLLSRARSGRGARVIPLRPWLAVPLAAAAAALIAVGIARETRLSQERDIVAAERNRLQTELAGAKSDLAKLTAALNAREGDVGQLRSALAAAEKSLAVLQERELQMVALRQPAEAPPAEAHLLLSVPAGKGLLYAFDLGAVSPDKIYELWWITEKEGPVMAGLFRPDDRGLGRLDVPVPANLGRIQAAAVTVEPAAGVPKPTGPMVLLGEVKS